LNEIRCKALGRIATTIQLTTPQQLRGIRPAEIDIPNLVWEMSPSVELQITD